MNNSDILDQDFRHHSEEERLEIKHLKFKIDTLLEKEIKNGKITLVVIALFSLVRIGLAMYNGLSSAEVIIESLILVACYLGLAIYAKVHPKFVFIASLSLYGFYQILYLVQNPESLGRGFIFKAVIIYYLFKAIQAGVEIARKRKRLVVLGEV